MSDQMDPIIVEHLAGSVLLLRLNRPEQRNALSTPTLLAIVEELTAAEANPGVGAVVITGSMSVFAAGADINELVESTGSNEVESPRFLAWQVIRDFSKPLIAAVEGWCLGAGCELALCCDIVVAGTSARFGQPETNLAIIPGAGGTATLPRRIGQQRAMLMVLTGRPISAADALECGLIAAVAQEGEALKSAIELASEIAQRAPRAIRAAKASIRLASSTDEADHLRRERELFVDLLGSEDKTEGIRAFKEKRSAIWKGL